MELNEKIYELAGRIEKLKNSISTEEATKTSMIMPFFSYWGMMFLTLLNLSRSSQQMWV